MILRIVIPGTPVAQGRPKVARTKVGVRVYDPKLSRDWKATAQGHMKVALGEHFNPGGEVYVSYSEHCKVYIPSGPTELAIKAYWPPINPPRKRKPRVETWRDKRPDADNVAKAVMDAGQGILWTDDSQVVRLTIDKLHAAQGDGARVELMMQAVEEV